MVVYNKTWSGQVQAIDSTNITAESKTILLRLGDSNENVMTPSEYIR